jgi:hypothetical protein
MTTHKPHKRRARGWMSGMKKGSAQGRTPLWQWVIGIPLLAIIAIAIASYLYVTYLNPKLASGARWVKGEVLDRVEKKTPEGTLDMSGSSLVVKVEGKELRLAPRLPEFNTISKGDAIEVEVSTTGGSLQAFSWRLPQAAPAPPAPGPAPSGPPPSIPPPR